MLVNTSVLTMGRGGVTLYGRSVLPLTVFTFVLLLAPIAGLDVGHGLRAVSALTYTALATPDEVPR
jgi:hypothetical protein